MIANKILKWILFLLTIIICFSCSIYTPKIAPFVNTQQKGDIQVDANIMLSNENIPSLNIEFASAYAMTDKSYIQLNYSRFRIFDPKNLFQISGGYKFKPEKKIYIDASIGYNYHEFYYTKWHNMNIKSMSSKDYYGSFDIPFTKIQIVYDNKKSTLLSVGLKTGLMYPNINDYNKKGFLMQPVLYYIPTKSESKYSCSFILSYSQIFPINDNKISFGEDYLFSKYGLSIGFCNTYRFDSKRMFDSLKNKLESGGFGCL